MHETTNQSKKHLGNQMNYDEQMPGPSSDQTNSNEQANTGVFNSIKPALNVATFKDGFAMNKI